MRIKVLHFNRQNNLQLNPDPIDMTYGCWKYSTVILCQVCDKAIFNWDFKNFPKFLGLKTSIVIYMSYHPQHVTPTFKHARFRCMYTFQIIVLIQKKWTTSSYTVRAYVTIISQMMYHVCLLFFPILHFLKIYPLYHTFLSQNSTYVVFVDFKLCKTRG